ncbi:MAG: nucleotidyl transferase AbiEii/AbiGii toxin family protein, partial [Pseudomonadales bacterium]|nr:nucleotidyl transferase AbiEii/AbiGii toxin family protein [Pseudomonadales bacterium]
MKEGYQRQVSLLLDVLPIVDRAKVFALKGGTAINFFFNDCPRLSVDIDLHYLPPHSRDDALQDIRKNMEAIKLEVEKSLSGVKMTIDPKTFNAQVQSAKALIKIEPNTVIRGTLLEPVEMPLCLSLEQEFSRGMNITCLAKAELYAGKLCAALQRQHPRDLFDTLLFLEQGEGLNRDAVDAFLIYLISQGKPIHEMLAPNIHDMEHLYNSQFLGMTKIEVNLDRLREVQSSLPRKIVTALTERDRAFLIGF